MGISTNRTRSILFMGTSLIRSDTTPPFPTERLTVHRASASSRPEAHMNLLIAVLLAATLYQVEPVNGTVSFSLMKWGVIREEGSFRDFKADIHYDARQPA